MKRIFPRSVAAWAFMFAVLGGFASVASTPSTEVIVSVPDQVLALVDRGRLIARYPISTSKFGIGDSAGSYRTPLGTLFVSAKFGDNLPPGAVIKNRVPTGELVTANAPGRDPIVARVIWLRGNGSAKPRCARSLYLHSRHTRGAPDRQTSQLWLHPYALARRDRAL